MNRPNTQDMLCGDLVMPNVQVFCIYCRCRWKDSCGPARWMKVQKHITSVFCAIVANILPLAVIGPHQTILGICC